MRDDVPLGDSTFELYQQQSSSGYALAIFDFGQNLKFIRIYGLARAIYGRVP